MGKLGEKMCLPSSENRKQLEQHPVAEWYPGRGPAANARPLVAPKRRGERQQCRPVCVWSTGDERLHSFRLLSGSRHRSSEHVHAVTKPRLFSCSCYQSVEAWSRIGEKFCASVWSCVLSPDFCAAVMSL